jgi:hypothetical protein
MNLESGDLLLQKLLCRLLRQKWLLVLAEVPQVVITMMIMITEVEEIRHLEIEVQHTADEEMLLMTMMIEEEALHQVEQVRQLQTMAEAALLLEEMKMITETLEEDVMMTTEILEVEDTMTTEEDLIQGMMMTVDMVQVVIIIVDHHLEMMEEVVEDMMIMKKNHQDVEAQLGEDLQSQYQEEERLQVEELRHLLQEMIQCDVVHPEMKKIHLKFLLQRNGLLVYTMPHLHHLMLHHEDLLDQGVCKKSNKDELCFGFKSDMFMQRCLFQTFLHEMKQQQKLQHMSKKKDNIFEIATVFNEAPSEEG